MVNNFEPNSTSAMEIESNKEEGELIERRKFKCKNYENL